jgi:hypothetical protein
MMKYLFGSGEVNKMALEAVHFILSNAAVCFSPLPPSDKWYIFLHDFHEFGNRYHDLCIIWSTILDEIDGS